MGLILTKKQEKKLNEIESKLQASKIRLTKGRHEILRIILGSTHATFNNIVDYLSEITDEKPNIMSVYNTINMLLTEHVIYANTFDGKQIYYEVRNDEEWHLKCDNCLQILHINQLTNLNKNLKKLVHEYQWSCDHFKIEIHGLCASCRDELKG